MQASKKDKESEPHWDPMSSEDSTESESNRSQLEISKNAEEQSLGVRYTNFNIACPSAVFTCIILLSIEIVDGVCDVLLCPWEHKTNKKCYLSSRMHSMHCFQEMPSWSRLVVCELHT